VQKLDSIYEVTNICVTLHWALLHQNVKQSTSNFQGWICILEKYYFYAKVTIFHLQ